MRAETDQRASQKYGMLTSETTSEVHVMPVDADGKPYFPHRPSADCPCHPWRDDFQPLLFIHDPIQ